MISLVSLLLLATPTLAAPAPAADCRHGKASLQNLANPDQEYEFRSRAGICLVRNRLDQSEVSRLVLSILRDPTEDTLLREDLIQAFAETSLRRQFHHEGHLAPKLDSEERAAMETKMSGVGRLLAAAEAVTSIEETVPTSRAEPEFFRAIAEIALDGSSHVLLRAAAVGALEKASVKVFESGVFDSHTLTLVRDTLRTVAARDDDASYFTSAEPAYRHLSVAGLPGFTRDSAVGTVRMISSVRSPGKSQPQDAEDQE